MENEEKQQAYDCYGYYKCTPLGIHKTEWSGRKKDQ